MSTVNKVGYVLVALGGIVLFILLSIAIIALLFSDAPILLKIIVGSVVLTLVGAGLTNVER